MPRYFLPSSESLGLLVQEKKLKIDFLDGCHDAHLGFLIGTILAIFDLQVTVDNLLPIFQVIMILPTKFRVSWPSGSREEAKRRFSTWQPWRPS